MTAPVADSFPPGRPWPGPPGPGEPPSRPGQPGWPGAPGWPAPHREPPAYPAMPPSRVWYKKHTDVLILYNAQIQHGFSGSHVFPESL